MRPSVSSGTSGGTLAVASDDTPTFSTVEYTSDGSADYGDFTAQLVLHDPLCPGTPISFLREALADLRAITDPYLP
mgnify:CR=1 FL=1